MKDNNYMIKWAVGNMLIGSISRLKHEGCAYDVSKAQRILHSIISEPDKPIDDILADPGDAYTVMNLLCDKQREIMEELDEHSESVDAERKPTDITGTLCIDYLGYIMAALDYVDSLISRR